MCNCDNRIDDGKQPSKIALMAEYHRGFVDGCNLRETATWQLDQERLVAVNRLRHIRDCLKGSSTGNSLSIADAIGVKLDVGDRLHKSICDRLIHLLGGNELDLQKSPIFENSGAEDAGRITESQAIERIEALNG